MLNYQGDRMQPAMMASDLSEKIKDSEKLLYQGKRFLKFEQWKLSKTSFVKGSQCLKYLYLDKHKKQVKTPISEETKQLFAMGHQFEDVVRDKEFPGGINVKDAVGNFAYFNSYTKYLLATQSEAIIYEATIIEQGVLVMCDVITKNANGDIDVYEIKLNTEINDAILQDLAVQYYVCSSRFGYKLNSFNLVFAKRDIEDQWVIEDYANELEERAEETAKRIELYKKTLEYQEPQIAMGEHCLKPYKCEFVEYCSNLKKK